MERAVFLDRDGVINRAVVVGGKPYPPACLDDLELLPGVPEGISALKAAHYRVIVITNQPDVKTGKQLQGVVEAMHRRLRSVLDLDDIYVCYHTDVDRCECRKPKPGMILEAAAKWKIHLAGSFVVGDRWRDVEAGQRAGCRTFWVRDDRYEEKKPDSPDWTVGSLHEVSTIICSLTHGNKEVA